ncbi:hypothetical protein G7054_g1163 [Neopestalotiopsis clavispora]|nr:hypothetical protein G7054_g1163 [Neopestalotiopsis clavispora]
MRPLNEFVSESTAREQFLEVQQALLIVIGLNKRLSRVISPTDDDNDWVKEFPESLKMSIHDFLRFVYVPDPRGAEVSVATCMVLDAIYLQMRPLTDQPGGLSISGTVPSASEIWHSAMWTKFLGRGWCPSDLPRLFMRFNTFGLHFIYNLPRPTDPCTHRIIQLQAKQKANANHHQCHTDSCQGCRDVVADQEELRRILEKGKIPLILSVGEEEDDDDESVTLVEAEADMSYVAISHVWSDGLGNVERNAIPQCQVRRLSRLVRGLSGKNSDMLLYWLDTICVPPDSAGMDKAQALALASMRKVYEEANVVLVLDQWLFNTPSKGKSHAELLMMIFSCAWNTRLWTYQEGALASSLLFQFSDTAYDLDDAIKALHATADNLTRRVLVASLDAIYFDLRGFKSHQSTEDKIGAIISAFRTRSTSVSTDEPLCLADGIVLESVTHGTMAFGFFPTTYYEHPWLGMGTNEFPSCSSGDYPKRTRRVRSRRGAVHFEREQDGLSDPNGLVLKSSGIRTLIGPGETPLGRNFFVRDEHGRWVLVKRIPEDDTRPSDHIFGMIEVAVIDFEDWRMFNNALLNTMSSTRGILVRIDREPKRGAPIHCTRLYRVLSIPMTMPSVVAENEAQLGPRPPVEGLAIATKNAEDGAIWCTHGTTCGDEQVWYVK